MNREPIYLGNSESNIARFPKAAQREIDEGLAALVWEMPSLHYRIALESGSASLIAVESYQMRAYYVVYVAVLPHGLYVLHATRMDYNDYFLVRNIVDGNYVAQMLKEAAALDQLSA